MQSPKHPARTVAAALLCLGMPQAFAQCSTSQRAINDIVIRAGAGPCNHTLLRKSLGQALANAQVISTPSPAAASGPPGALANIERTPAQAALWRISLAQSGQNAAPVMVMPGLSAQR